MPAKNPRYCTWSNYALYAFGEIERSDTETIEYLEMYRRHLDAISESGNIGKGVNSGRRMSASLKNPTEKGLQYYG